MKGTPCSYESDVWSLGLSNVHMDLGEFVFGKARLRYNDRHQVLHDILKIVTGGRGTPGNAHLLMHDGPKFHKTICGLRPPVAISALPWGKERGGFFGELSLRMLTIASRSRPLARSFLRHP